MWCNVVICGSLFSSKDDIKKIKNYLLNKNNSNIYYNPIVPFKCTNDKFALPFNETVRKWYNAIDRSHVVIGVTKPDGSFGEGTTYELEYARKINKNIIIYNAKDKNFYPYDNNMHIIYDDIFSKLKEFEYLGDSKDSKYLQDRSNNEKEYIRRLVNSNFGLTEGILKMYDSEDQEDSGDSKDRKDGDLVDS